MLIDIGRIPPEGQEIVLPEDALELGDSAGLWEGAATVRAEMHLERSGRGVVIGGSFVGGVSLICGRCLEPFPFEAQDRFDLYCEMPIPRPAEEERALAPDELDVTYLEDGHINTDELLRENLLLSLPLQPLCRDDCRGLCPRCGANLNQGPCGCEPPPADPRMDALRKLLPNG
jgi:uncharacterized protein